VDQTLLGTEQADLGEKPGFGKLLRSNLLFVPVANILYGLIYVSSLYLALSYGSSRGFDSSSLVATWAVVELVATILFMLVKARRAARSAKLFPGISVAYYAVASAVMAGVVYLLSGLVATQGVATLLYGTQLVLVCIAGAVVYFGVVYGLDSRFRDMTNSLLRRI